MAPNDDKPRRRDGLRRWIPVVILLLAPLALVLVVLYLPLEQITGSTRRQEIAYTEFKALVEQGQVEEIVVRDRAVEGKLRAPAPLGPRREPGIGFTTMNRDRKSVV